MWHNEWRSTADGARRADEPAPRNAFLIDCKMPKCDSMRAGSNVANPSAHAISPSEVGRPRDAMAFRSNRVTSGPVRNTLLMLALPVFGEQLLNTFVGLFDTWLAGRISAAATSAVGLSAYVNWLASVILMLIATGTTALVSRHEGAGRHDEANRDANQSMTLAAILGGVLLAFLYALAPVLARYTNMSGEAYAISVNYLRMDAFGHPFLSMTLVGCAALRGVGNMRTPLVLFAVINAVNVVASLTFVYLAGLGVRGIVAGTVTARVVGGLLILIVLWQGQAGLSLFRAELGLVGARTRRILRIGIPAAIDGAIMWGSHFAFLGIVGRVAQGAFGQASFAAHVIAVRAEAFTYLPAIAWAAAAATMVGQALGARDPARARRVGHEAVLQCGLLSLLIVAGFYFGAEQIYALMSTDPMVRAAGVRPFRILAVLQPCMVVSIIYVGALRGAGETRSPMIITICGALIRLPTGFYFGLVQPWGLLGAWIGMFGDMLWRAFAAAACYLRGTWLTTKI